MKSRVWVNICAVFLVLVLCGPASSDEPPHRQEFVSKVTRFANLNRLSITRLHRDAHADCYIAVTLATVIQRDGSVKEISVLNSSTVPVVDRYFRYVIEQAAPYPALDGYYDPVPAEVSITHEFRLDVRLQSDGLRSERPCQKLKSPVSNQVRE